MTLRTGTTPATPPHVLLTGAKPVRTVVRYQLWDANQLPVYRACAQSFMENHPDIEIRLQQVGWGEYWTSLALGFISESAPDVFVNHAIHFPRLHSTGVLENLSPWLGAAEWAPEAFEPGLAQAWSHEGRRYALPKDWDTVALLVNLDHAERQGVTRQELEQLQWNPTDGGTFEAMLRRLAVDVHGRPATDPAFNPAQVRVWAYQTPGVGGLIGQTEWAHWAGSTGYQIQPTAWALPLNLRDPRWWATIDWLASLAPKGLSASVTSVQSLGAPALFLAGRVAMVPDGSWMIRHYARAASFRTVWIPLPVGPAGHRSTLFNGVGDSLWAGSKVKPQAVAWIRHMASESCQRILAQSGVVFPARKGLQGEAEAVHRAAGRDVKAFFTMAAGPTVRMPLVVQASRVDGILKSALESVLLGKEPAASALSRAADRVEALTP